VQTATFADRRAEAVRAAQVRSSFEHLPLTLTASVINSLLLGFVEASVVPPPIVASWISLVIALSALRAGLWYAHRRTHVGVLRKVGWATLATTGTLISGVLWGSTPLLFAPLDEAHLLFLAFVLAGMSAGAATVHAAHFPLPLHSSSQRLRHSPLRSLSWAAACKPSRVR
jgi:hypothetical protein